MVLFMKINGVRFQREGGAGNWESRMYLAHVRFEIYISYEGEGAEMGVGYAF